MKRMVAFSDLNPEARAEVTKYLGMDGVWKEVDLTADEWLVFAATFKKIWDAGRVVDRVPARAMRKPSVKDTAEPARHAGQGPGGWASSRKYWDEFRRWCDANGRTYKVPSGFSPKQQDVADFEEYRRGLDHPGEPGDPPPGKHTAHLDAGDLALVR